MKKVFKLFFLIIIWPFSFDMGRIIRELKNKKAAQNKSKGTTIPTTNSKLWIANSNTPRVDWDRPNPVYYRSTDLDFRIGTRNKL